jgi:hypothetical protein
MKKYEEATLEIVAFDAEDVITTSPTCPADCIMGE